MTSQIVVQGRISPNTGSVGKSSGAFLNGRFLPRYYSSFVNKTFLAANSLPLMRCTKSAMNINIFIKPLLRLLLFLVISFPLRILLDLIFALVYRNYDIVRTPLEYVGAAIITVIILETVLFVKSRLNLRYPWEENPLRRLTIEIGINSVLLSVVIISLSLFINYYLLEVQFIKFSDEVLKTLFYLVLLVHGPAFFEFAVFLLNRWRISLAEMERYKKENAEYRFETLRTQVNPHFLFNSLNTLSSLVYENKEKAVDFIRDLSDVYRYVLDNRSRETILLADEVRFIKSFVYLYQLRFDNKLDVEFNIPEIALDRLIAPMTLQLLVENAVKHNVVSTKKPLKISISADGADYITVTNNLQKKNMEMTSSAIGLKNIISRYSFLTDKQVGVTETETEFIVKVPLI